MAVYVDNSRLEWRGKLWCHMVADSLEELHEFAARLQLKREWFQHRSAYPHYDVTVNVRDRALGLGASLGNKEVIIGCAKKMRLEQIAQQQAQQQVLQEATSVVAS